MLSCKEVTRLTSLAQERPLGLWERAQLQLHLLICKHCSNFSKNVRALRDISREHAQRDDN